MLLRTSLAAAAAAAAVGATAQFDCEKIPLGDSVFNLGALEGVHSVVTTRDTGSVNVTTSYSVDLCGFLGGSEHVSGKQCPGSSKGTPLI